MAATLARIALGSVMTLAGITHLTVARDEFQAQVPDWFPLDKDFVVVASGVAEIGLGAAFLALPRHRRTVGMLLALFFIAIFPGNIAQYVEGTDAFGLDTDTKRLVRLFFQPVLVLLALWAGGWIGSRGDRRTDAAG
ncbi:DoxX family protein [Nocardioides sambongensis]|uniref:DoxX family protein n=1 Tax=Nocardioides sambongensis TaxID=2589074 RepID=UPI00112B3B85|nr:DoxX family membrane protein [Nocardioides sambongensis]